MRASVATQLRSTRHTPCHSFPVSTRLADCLRLVLLSFFPLFIVSVLCISGGFVARDDVGNFCEDWWRRLVCMLLALIPPPTLSGYSQVSYCAAIVVIACDPHGRYLVPGHSAWFWACISCRSQLENVRGTLLAFRTSGQVSTKRIEMTRHQLCR